MNGTCAANSSIRNDESDTYVPESQLVSDDPEAPKDNGIFSDVMHDTLKEPDYERYLLLVPPPLRSTFPAASDDHPSCSPPPSSSP